MKLSDCGLTKKIIAETTKVVQGFDMEVKGPNSRFAKIKYDSLGWFAYRKDGENIMLISPELFMAFAKYFSM